MTGAAAADGKFRELDRDVEMVAHAHQRLLAALDRLVESNGLDAATSSRLPGWSRGHVLTHITNSGRGHAAMLQGAARGESVAQYPNGIDSRTADIEAGATRPADVQRDDLRRSIYELEAEYAASTWIGSGPTLSGEVAMVDLPFLRMREVAIHHIDLDIGAEFADLPEPYVRLELARLEERWTARQPTGEIGLPAGALALSPPDRLAWMMGRFFVDELAPAAIF